MFYFKHMDDSYICYQGSESGSISEYLHILCKIHNHCCMPCIVGHPRCLCSSSLPRPFFLLQRHQLPIQIVYKEPEKVTAIYLPREIKSIKLGGFLDYKIGYNKMGLLPPPHDFLLPDISLPTLREGLPLESLQCGCYEIDHTFEKYIYIDDIEYKRFDVTAFMHMTSEIRFVPRKNIIFDQCDIYLETLMSNVKRPCPAPNMDIMS